MTDEAEKAWNKEHGLTATCPVCGSAMKPERQVCTWACFYRRERSLEVPHNSGGVS